MEHGQLRELRRALGLTFASAVIWGIAHVWAGRKMTGALLAAAFAVIIAGVTVAATGYRSELTRLAVQPNWLTGIIVGLVMVAVTWIVVVVSSFWMVKPAGLTAGPRAAAIAGVVVLCLAIAAPFAVAADNVLAARKFLTSTFTAEKATGVTKADPWGGRTRLNVLLLGGDAGANRVGVRTDSVTLASIDTKTGNTVLLGLPRNLEKVPMPPGPPADRFPAGFSGDGPGTPGLLNEIYQYAEEHPEIMPGVPQGKRGPALLLPTVEGVLGQKIDYYIMVDMRGFAQLIDAMGGVYMRIPEDITFGKYNEGRLAAGYRKLSGTEALWFGRSRTFSDDYVRMGRQKCLLKAVVRQADPQKILRRFQDLAQAAKHTISTDIPANLLPPIVDLSQRAKDSARITSLQFVPPLISTAQPDFAFIRQRAAQAINDSVNADASSASPAPQASSPTTTAQPRRNGTAQPSAAPSAEAKAVSLDATCPS